MAKRCAQDEDLDAGASKKAKLSHPADTDIGVDSSIRPEDDLTDARFKDKYTVFADSLTFDVQTKNEIVMATMGQADNENWHQMRSCKLTASKYGLILNWKKRPVENILRELLYLDISNIPAVQHGRMNEGKAVELYARKAEENGRFLQVVETGLHVCTQPGFGYLAASPDRIVVDRKTNKMFLLEVKCLYDKSDDLLSTVRELAHKRGSKFYCYFDKKGNLQLKRNSNYFYQVMGQLGILEMDYCEFVMNYKSDTYIIPIRFEQRVWDDMKSKLRHFYINCFLPELNSRRVMNGSKLF